jgi:hypothetical protein
MTALQSKVSRLRHELDVLGLASGATSEVQIVRDDMDAHDIDSEGVAREGKRVVLGVMHSRQDSDFSHGNSSAGCMQERVVAGVGGHIVAGVGGHIVAEVGGHQACTGMHHVSDSESSLCTGSASMGCNQTATSGHVAVHAAPTQNVLSGKWQESESESLDHDYDLPCKGTHTHTHTHTNTHTSTEAGVILQADVDLEELD